MELIVICTAIVVFMPLFAKIPVAIEMKKLDGYDNKHPRAQQSHLKGFGARAMAAHQNCYEAIAFYAPTVLLVLAFDSHTVYTAYLCLAFVVLRLFYLFCYWLNWDIARSLIWVIAMGTLVAHYVLLLD